jgi:hypothetical protein
MQHLLEIPPTTEVEMLEDAFAIEGELRMALESAKELKRLSGSAESSPDDSRTRQALLLQVVVMLGRAVTKDGQQKDRGRKHPLSSEIYDKFENGAEAWDFFKVLRDKILIHDESPALQVKVGAFKVGHEVGVGHLAMRPAFEHDPECIDMLGQMISHALRAATERIGELEKQVGRQLACWDSEAATPVRVTVPPKDDLKKDRRTWTPS